MMELMDEIVMSSPGSLSIQALKVMTPSFCCFMAHARRGIIVFKYSIFHACYCTEMTDLDICIQKSASGLTDCEIMTVLSLCLAQYSLKKMTDVISSDILK